LRVRWSIEEIVGLIGWENAMEHSGQMRPGDIIITVFNGGKAFLLGRMLDPNDGRGNREELGTSGTLDDAMAKACSERNGHNAWIINEDDTHQSVRCPEHSG
jgi:hypothetical protein